MNSPVWHPFTAMKEQDQEELLVIEGAEGSYLIDTQGRRYLDGVSSLWVTVHGHRKQAIDEAIRAQLDRVAHSTFLGLSHVPGLRLAEKLVSLAPKNLSKVFYSDSGSSAVEIALKMAFQSFQNRGLRQKTRFATLSNAYHGDTLGAVSVGGIELFHSIYKPLLFEAFQIPNYDLARTQRLFQEKHAEIAALIVEPCVQAAAGMLLQPTGFLQNLRKLTQDYGIFLIVDEVATGFGRTGKLFACEHEGIAPDFLCLAKGLTGGYLPLAATLTTEAVYQTFYADYQELKTFFHGHTYTANPLACAAALANLELFESEKTLENLSGKITQLTQLLKIFEKHPNVKEVRQKGFMVGIELVKDKATKLDFLPQERIGHKVTLEARKRGAILRPLGSVLVLMPPLSICSQELESLVNITFEALEAQIASLNA